MTEGLPGAADRAAAAVRALARAHDAAAAAAGLLARADAVDWRGPGAAGYRDELAGVLAGVRRAARTVAAAGAAAAEHAAALRDAEDRARSERAAVGVGTLPGWGPALGPPGTRELGPPGARELGPRPGPWATR